MTARDRRDQTGRFLQRIAMDELSSQQVAQDRVAVELEQFAGQAGRSGQT